MKLPNAEKARVEESKVLDYLLAFDHPEGSGKAVFFKSFGLTAARWQDLDRALVDHAQTHPISSSQRSPYGTKYCIDGLLRCPDGRTPSVRTVWIVDFGKDYPRLVTAHPL